MKSRRNNAFTLIELIIAITISTMLMVSVTVFVGDVMRITKKSEKLLDTQAGSTAFDNKLSEIFSNLTGSGIISSGSTFGSYSSGTFLKTGYDRTPIVFIGTKTFSGNCTQSGSSFQNVKKLVIKELSPEGSHSGTVNYRISFGKNAIIDSTGNVIIGNGTRGEDIDFRSLTGTLLNNPSAIIEKNPVGSTFLPYLGSGSQNTDSAIFIADTGNDRILAANITKGTIKIISNSKNGISKPLDIYLSVIDDGIYVANAGDGRILKIKNTPQDISKASIHFTSTLNAQVDMFKLTFPGFTDITGPISDADFIFSANLPRVGTDTVLPSGNSISYKFTSMPQMLVKGLDYDINVNSIAYTSFDSTKNSIVKVDFYNGANLVYSNILPFYLKDDQDNPQRTYIQEISSGSIIPNNITSSTAWDDTIINWNKLLNSSLQTEYISEYPVNSISILQKGKIISAKVNYYKYIDCIGDGSILKDKLYMQSTN